METNNDEAAWQTWLQLVLDVFKGVPALTHVAFCPPNLHGWAVVLKHPDEQMVWMAQFPATLRFPSFWAVSRLACVHRNEPRFMAWSTPQPWMVTIEKLEYFYPPAPYLDLAWRAYTIDGVLINGNE